MAPVLLTDVHYNRSAIRFITMQARPATMPVAATNADDHAEIKRVALELEGRHGPRAASVARFIAELNEQQGHTGQSLSWRTVCDTIEARTLERIRNTAERTLARRFH